MGGGVHSPQPEKMLAGKRLLWGCALFEKYFSQTTEFYGKKIVCEIYTKIFLLALFAVQERPSAIIAGHRPFLVL